MKDILRKSAYILALIFGITLLLCAAGLTLGMLYLFGVVIWEHVSQIGNVPFKELIAIIIIITIGVAFMFLLQASPDIISWAWKKLKEK